jgi:hypothetical protein
MKIGTLCRVVKFKTHCPCQYNDMVVVIGFCNIDNRPSHLLICTNLKTGKSHHYWSTQLEQI